jgi:hypothetical protein
LCVQATQRRGSQALIQTARSISLVARAPDHAEPDRRAGQALLKSDGSRIHLFDSAKGLLHCVVALHPDAAAVMAVSPRRARVDGIV